MGLTIHYQITAPADWTKATIKAKLEEVRQFAKTLPVLSVSELAEFAGDEANFQKVRDTGREEQDDFFWAKIQAQRHLLNPWCPGTHGSQPPNHMTVFSVLPADGCEQMNIGVCKYPRHVWKAMKNVDSEPAWSLVFDERNPYRASRKVMRAFCRRWKLRRLPKSKWTVNERFGSAVKLPFYLPNGFANAGVHRGRYLSHRKGYGNPVPIVTICDRMTIGIAWRFMGTPQEAEKVFASAEFRADLSRMVHGEDSITPPAKGIWSSFCKTQYANSPDCGGWPNFAKAHIAVLAILEKMQGLGFTIVVEDEGGFWRSRDLKELAKMVGHYDVAIAGLVGALKDVAGAQGMDVESAMSGRSDFEQLEMRAQGSMGEWLKKLTKGSQVTHDSGKRQQ